MMVMPDDHDDQLVVDDNLDRVDSPTITSELTRIGLLAVLPILLLVPPYMLEHPYWYDESWVAVATRAPISKLLLATSSTPIGWTILMVLIPGPGDQRQRLLPLAFAVGTVVFAYLLARDLQWPTPASGRIAGVVTAIFVAAAPIALLRQDLKQYTADACLTLMFVWLVVRLEKTWSMKRLWTLVVVGVVGSLVSYALMFVVAAAMVSLVIVAAAQRNRRRTLDVVGAGATTAVGYAAVAVFLLLPRSNERLAAFWERYYIDTGDGVRQIVTEIWHRIDGLAPLLGFKWPVLTIILVIAGSIVIARSGRPASAAILPILYVEMLALGILDKYPFLNQRTSHFLLLLTVAVVAVGVAGIANGLHQRWRGMAVGSVVLLGTVGFFLFGASSYVGGRTIPNEDVRTQTHYVEEHLEAGDTILVSAIGSYGFAYYWQRDDPLFVPSDAFSNGFGVEFDAEDIVIATHRTKASVTDALDEAIDIASSPNGSGRIWLVRTHVSKDERAMWASALDRPNLSLEELDNGREPVSLIRISIGRDE